MSTYTENLNLVMPSTEEYFDISDFNENMESIDSEIGLLDGKIGTPVTEGDTLFSLLSGSNGIIKSVQHVTLDIKLNVTTTAISINPVDTSRSFVIFERLRDSSGECTSVTYTLNEDNLAVTHSKYTSSMPNVTFGFWIIEFY